MKLSKLSNDRGAFMLQIGILQIIGYILISVSSLSVYLHNGELFQETLLGGIYAWSWLLVAFGVGAIVAKYLQDPKIVLCVMVVAALVWGFVVM